MESKGLFGEKEDKMLTSRMCKIFNCAEGLHSKCSVRKKKIHAEKNTVLCSYAYFKILKSTWSIKAVLKPVIINSDIKSLPNL